MAEFKSPYRFLLRNTERKQVIHSFTEVVIQSWIPLQEYTGLPDIGLGIEQQPGRRDEAGNGTPYTDVLLNGTPTRRTLTV